MQHYEGDNIGGIFKLEYCPHYGFSSFNPAVLAAGYTWHEIPFKGESCELFLKLDTTPHGPLFTYSGPFAIHNQRDEVETTLFPYVGKHLVLRLTDMNGRVYIIGAPDAPVELSLGAKSGQRYVDENGTGFSFEVAQIDKAVAV